MKHGVSTYSFESYLSTGRMTVADAVCKAGELGFDGVELANLTGSYAYDPDELRRAAQESNVELYSWATSADFAENPEEQVEWLRQELDRAAELGCRLVRTDLYHGDVTDPYDERALSAVRKAADLAAQRGITLVTENHGGCLCTAQRLDTLVQRLNHPNFGLLCDFANFADADEDPARAVALLAGQIRHVHMKDCHLLDGDRLFPGEGWYVTRAGNYWRCAITGQGNLPLYRCLKSLCLAGYDGYLVQEFEGIEDCIVALRAGLNYTRRLLAALPDGMWSDTYAL